MSARRDAALLPSSRSVILDSFHHLDSTGYNWHKNGPLPGQGVVKGGAMTVAEVKLSSRVQEFVFDAAL